MKSKYTIIALIGEAGSGKDTLMKEILSQTKDLHEIISCTTRSPREGEINGINYYFLTEEDFNQKILNEEMLETTCFNNWFYGTSYDSLKSDCINIGVFNPDGIVSIMKHKDIKIMVYYIQANEKQRLLRQLNREENPNVKEIIRRYSTDLKDFKNLDFYYNILENNTLDDLVHNTKTILFDINLLQGKI